MTTYIIDSDQEHMKGRSVHLYRIYLEKNEVHCTDITHIICCLYNSMLELSLIGIMHGVITIIIIIMDVINRKVANYNLIIIALWSFLLLYFHY